MELSHLAFFSLMMAFASLWIHRSAGLWGGFLVISYIIAFNTCVVQPISILPIGVLFAIFWALKKVYDKTARFALTLIAIGVAAALKFHLLSGFQNWHVSGNFWVNYDSPFIGFFALVFLLPLIRSPSEWYNMAVKALPLTLLSVVLLAVLALPAGAIDWHFKIPSHFLLRVAANLFLVVIPEEAFFRGFVQQEIFNSLGQGVKGHIAAVIGASLLFTVFHVGWTSCMPILGFVFLAGVLYGCIYQYLKTIESSMLCHFAVNLLHMTFFTYHAE